MSKDSSAKYYQNNKERPQKKLVKDIVHKRKKVKEGLSKEYKEKTDNMVVNDTKIYHKKQKLVEYRRKYYKMSKNASL